MISTVGLWAGYCVLFYKHFRCQACPRFAFHHKVPETGQRTCDKHTTVEDHAELKRKHRLKFPHHLAHKEAA